MRIASLTAVVVSLALGVSSAHAEPGSEGAGAAPATRPVAAADGDARDGDARDEEARSLFKAGVSAYDSGRYEDALTHFRRAYELSDRPQMLFNIAQAADRLRMDDEALRALRAYRERLPDADNRVQVENRIRALEATQAGAVEPAEPIAPAEQTHAGGAGPASALDASLHTPPGQTADEDGGLLSQWWFWTAAGAVVVSVVAGVALAASDDGEAPARATGTDGMVILTLGGR